MTAPAEDFLAAHRRHWEDAEFLFGDSRWPNADQLYGMSAECGLKTMLEIMGVPIKSSHRAHVDWLWGKFRSEVEAWGEARYAVEGDPFSDWSISERYAHGSHVDRRKAERHREGAEQVFRRLEEATTDGVL